MKPRHGSFLIGAAELRDLLIVSSTHQLTPSHMCDKLSSAPEDRRCKPVMQENMKDRKYFLFLFIFFILTSSDLNIIDLNFL